MQSWAKRGLQTALVTGGLLMLGTGIASAEGHPDVPAGPLDLNVNVPVDIAANAIGTPLGQLDLPNYKGQISTKFVTEPLNTLAKNLDKNPVEGTIGAKGNGGLTPTHDVLKGNKIAGDLTVPVQAVGNAIGVIGDAHVESTGHKQEFKHNQNIITKGDESGLAGNAVALDWALPVQLAGNAGGVLGGSAHTKGDATQSVIETGNTTTSGKDASLAGNIVAPQFATPIQVTGNSISYILGNAHSEFDAKTSATSGGWLKSQGKSGSVTGNVVGAPIALPVKVNGNSAAAWGSNAKTESTSQADAYAGDTKPGLNDIPSYINTGGSKTFLGGNAVQPQGALVANVTGNAASWIGNAATGNALGEGYAAAGSTSSDVKAGGFTSTDGDMSAGGGNIVDAPIALPVEAFGIGGSYIGNSHAAQDSNTSTVAGDGTYTRANHSFLGGNSVNAQPASTVEAYGLGASHIGQGVGQGTETKFVKSGGYNGTLSDHSGGSGNLVQVPVVIPAEVFGSGASFIGQGAGSASETKVLQGGGGGNTEDPYGAATSNLVAVPVALPAQVFGVGAAVIGTGAGEASTDTTATAGGDLNAIGDNSGVSGNIATVPVALPTQLHGLGAAVAGLGNGASDSLTDAKAGGNTKASGKDGAVAGNVVGVPVGGSIEGFGTGAAAAGLAGGQSIADVASVAGGDTRTAGDRGGLSGNIIGAQALPVASVFGDGVAAAAKATGVSAGVFNHKSGGDVKTSGTHGSLSGDIVDVPVAGVAQVFGDGIAAVGGNADGAADNVTTGVVGGKSSTRGKGSELSGIDGQLPLGALVQAYNLPVEVLARATAAASNDTQITREPQINLPISDSELGINELPGLSADRTARADLPELPIAVAPQVPALQGLAGVLGGLRN